MNRDQKIEHSTNATKEKTEVHEECCIILKKDEEIKLGTCELSAEKNEQDE